MSRDKQRGLCLIGWGSFTTACLSVFYRDRQRKNQEREFCLCVRADVHVQVSVQQCVCPRCLPLNESSW